MQKKEQEVQKKDEMIAELLAKRKSKTDYKQVQMSAGGEVVELVSAADLKALEARVEACEAHNEAQDAKIGALRDKPAPPNPAAAAARPPAAARRQLSSATGDETEVAITGRKATLSFNSRTPDVTPTRLTGEGDGKLTCSGELHATDFVTADGESVTERIEALRGNFTEFVTEQLKDGVSQGLASVSKELEAVRQFVGMVPPSPPSPPPPPVYDTDRMASLFSVYTGAVSHWTSSEYIPSDAIGATSWSNRDGSHSAMVFRSPVFTAGDGSGHITSARCSTVGGTGNAASPLSPSSSYLNAAAQNSGFMGIGARNVATDSYDRSARRTFSNQASSGIEVISVDLTGLYGNYTLDLIDASCCIGWAWLAVFECELLEAA
mmetsp:Transcript_43531/g.141231  ORF Transcript_43531/g.141231 Transcript_43531/m.141231 type:complete len:379 (-) Transcript_43531:172-1308(-)